MRVEAREMVCPLCGETVEEVVYMNYDRPWVSVNPREGLAVYGPYSSDKGPYCEWFIKGGKVWGLHLGDRIILREGYNGSIPFKEVPVA